MTKAKPKPATDETAAEPTPALTDKGGQVHYPYSEGGPTFATVCGSDGEPWPCAFAKDEGYDPAPIPQLDEIVGASIEGTNAHAVTISGAESIDDMIAAGISEDAAKAIDAANRSDGSHGGDGGAA